MPRMPGFELLSVVRRKLPEIYVIASSGAFSEDGVPNGIAADAFHEKTMGLAGLFEMVNTAVPVEDIRAGSAASTPIWISPFQRDDSSNGQLLISCPECLRSFSLAVGAADFVIHEANCVFCGAVIHYAPVQPMNPELPHRFGPKPKATSSHSAEVATH